MWVVGGVDRKRGGGIWSGESGGSGGCVPTGLRRRGGGVKREVGSEEESTQRLGFWNRKDETGVRKGEVEELASSAFESRRSRGPFECKVKFDLCFKTTVDVAYPLACQRETSASSCRSKSEEEAVGEGAGPFGRV